MVIHGTADTAVPSGEHDASYWGDGERVQLGILSHLTPHTHRQSRTAAVRATSVVFCGGRPRPRPLGPGVPGSVVLFPD